MAKKKNELVSIKPKQLFKIIPPGECPYCHQGPIAVMVSDRYPMIIDRDGYAMTLGETRTNTIGLCTKCGKVLGNYEQHMFKWFPENHPFKNQSLEETYVKPSYNFFGNIHEQMGEKQEWIIQTLGK